MILYSVFRALEFFLRLLPRRWRKGFFYALADLAYSIDAAHRKIVRQNLLFAYDGDIDDAAIDRITRACYRNLMLNFYQVMENYHEDAAQLYSRTTFVNRHYIDDALAAGRPMVIVAAHHGNWEMGATAVASELVALTSIHKPLKNPYFNRYLLASRSRHRMTMVEKGGAIRHLAKALRTQGAVSLMVDQNINPKESIAVDFFGKKVSQTFSPAFLARKFDALIIPVFIVAGGGDHYTMHIETPLEVRKSDDADADIFATTQALSDVVETYVRRYPEQWFWCHKRWKNTHPEIYA